jgi:metallophosphoesterase superfamily enzyme
MKDFRPRLRGNVKKAYEKMTEVKNRVLVIGDPHEPFCHKNYLEHCKKTYAENNCNRVVIIGDIIDNHFGSYHEVSSDAQGGKYELEQAIKGVKDWNEAFPDADVTIGNHDRIIMRKAQSSNIPSLWIKEFAEVLGTPNWRFVTEVYIDGVRYVHGDKSGKPRTAAKRDMVSTVSGHFHTDMYVEFFFGVEKVIFAMAVGCGIDTSSHAMAYMEGGKQAAMGCGVVIDGEIAFNVPMYL